MDGRFKLNPNWIVLGQLMRSYTQQTDGTPLTGPAYRAELSHAGRHFHYSARYLDRSPTFRSQLGFIPRVDIRQVEQSAGYRWRPSRRRLLNFGPGLSVLVNWDREGRVQDWLMRANFALELTGQTYLTASRSEAFEVFQGLGFRQRRTGLEFSTQWLEWLNASAHYQWGTGINFSPARGQNPFLANLASGGCGFTLRPSRRFRLGQTYLYSRLGTRRPAILPEAAPAPNVFNNHILRTKLNYQFSRQLSLRAILDYSAVLPNPSLVALERSKRFKADLLLTYLIHPGTAFYLGFTDGYENLAIVPTLPAAPRRTRLPSTSTGRQFFVKLSYLFRF